MSTLREPTCGDCKALYMEAKDIYGHVSGLCRRRPELGDVPISMSYCKLFTVREGRAGEVNVPQATSKAGPRRAATAIHTREIPTLQHPAVGDTEGEINMDRNGLKQIIRELLEEETLYGYPEMGGRWQDGTLVMKPADESLQAKELPLDTFFHKIVMLRDRLRVLEAKVNSHDKLSDHDKFELQGYITKCYGTLTTFNVLFKDSADHFSSK